MNFWTFEKLVKLWIREYFSFFFHAKSDTTNFHLRELSDTSFKAFLVVIWTIVKNGQKVLPSVKKTGLKVLVLSE